MFCSWCLCVSGLCFISDLISETICNFVCTDLTRLYCGIVYLNIYELDHSRADDDKIIGGYECTPHSQPWQIYLTYDDGERWCGASLISDLWAVSAAHCYLP